MNYTIQRKAFNFVKGIRWDHLDRQKLIEDQLGTYETRNDTGLLIECGLSEPGLLQNILNKMRKDYGYQIMHIYYCRLTEAETGGYHNDSMDVTIVQSYGRMKYLIEGDEIILGPGDALHIPAGVYHEGVHIEPRITCSFCMAEV